MHYWLSDFAELPSFLKLKLDSTPRLDYEMIKVYPNTTVAKGNYVVWDPTSGDKLPDKVRRCDLLILNNPFIQSK